MSIPLAVGFLIVEFGMSLWLTGWFRRYAVAEHLVDVPNERSSHLVATPRGGGVAIVLTTVISLAVLGTVGILPWSLVTALLGSGAGIAAVGFVDDRGHVAARWRLLGHFASAVWLLAWVGGLPPLPLLGRTIHFGWIGNTAAVLYVVWLVNLTNFMDGIDGIAAIEVITVCFGGALLNWVAAPAGTPWAAPAVLAAATLGFLVWNWPKAKIFMGDAGSGFLGLMLAALSLQAAWISPTLFCGWLVLLGVFVVDATVTLIRRVGRGEKFYEAHRTHAYQHVARRTLSHLRVTLFVAAINVCWLLPIGLFVARGVVDGALGVLVAYLPLVVAAIRLGAGAPTLP